MSNATVPLVDKEIISSRVPVFSEVRVTQSLIFCVVLCGQLFVFLSFIFLPLLYFLSFDLRLLVTYFVCHQYFLMCLSGSCIHMFSSDHSYI